MYVCIEQLVLGYIEFFERLTEMMECIGTHLSYLSEYSRPMFQESKKLQKVSTLQLPILPPTHLAIYLSPLTCN